MQNQQAWFQEELNKLTNNNEGNVGFSTYFTAMKNSSARLRAELTKVILMLMMIAVVVIMMVIGTKGVTTEVWC